MKNDIAKIGLFGFLPIIVGGFIYLISRQKTILLFDWIKLIKMDNESNTIREFFAKYYLPEWFKFNLPDLLWVFGFTSVMLIIWESVQSKIKFFYIILPLFIGVASELLQYFIPNFGTFDLTDILFYTIGSLTSILILKTINQSKYEKQITTSF
jgi:hypothetical protein